jgi:hypothetical protein
VDGFSTARNSSGLSDVDVAFALCLATGLGCGGGGAGSEQAARKIAVGSRMRISFFIGLGGGSRGYLGDGRVGGVAAAGGAGVGLPGI